MYSSRPGARTAHIGSVRLARENLHFGVMQNLRRCVLHGTCREERSMRDT